MSADKFILLIKNNGKCGLLPVLILVVSLLAYFLWIDFSQVRPISNSVSTLIEHRSTATTIGEIIADVEVRQANRFW